MKQSSLLALLLLSCAILDVDAQDVAEKVSLEQQLRNSQQQLVQTWRVDADSTAAHARKRFGDKAVPLGENNMLKQFKDVDLRMSDDGVMRMIDRTDPTKELHRASFFLVIERGGTVYFIGEGPSATGLNVVGTIAFDDGKLVWSAKKEGPHCAVFVAQ